jgi:hypothetical protein
MYFQGIIGGSKNSGFQAVNMAANLGVRGIVLVGFDMHIDAGTHWHGDHKGGLSNPTQGKIEVWRSEMDRAAKDLRGIGVKVFNASEGSALTAYPKLSVSDALGVLEC